MNVNNPVPFVTYCYRRLRIIFILLLASHITAHAQKVQGTKLEATAKERIDFYKFMIPASINGSDIAPAAISSFKVDLGEDETAFKYGNAFKKADEEDNADDTDLKNSYFFSVGAKATDGVTTLYKHDDAAVEFTAKGGVTLILSESYWNFTAPPKDSGQRSTEMFTWFNLVPKVSVANLNVFSDDTTYKKKERTTYSVMASWNIYYHSRMRYEKLKNGIFSVAVGLGRINNYNVLPEITRQKGILQTALPYTYYTTKEEAVKGRLGTLEERHGFIYSFEGYKAICRTFGFSCYLGARYFGYAAAHSVANGSAGLFFSFSDKAAKKNIGDPDKYEEKFGFAINGVATNFQEINDSDAEVSFRENFVLSLSASVPLKFNYEKGR